MLLQAKLECAILLKDLNVQVKLSKLSTVISPTVLFSDLPGILDINILFSIFATGHIWIIIGPH